MASAGIRPAACAGAARSDTTRRTPKPLPVIFASSESGVTDTHDGHRSPKRAGAYGRRVGRNEAKWRPTKYAVSRRDARANSDSEDENVGKISKVKSGLNG